MTTTFTAGFTAVLTISKIKEVELKVRITFKSTSW
jgi:hypothetical protein